MYAFKIFIAASNDLTVNPKFFSSSTMKVESFDNNKLLLSVACSIKLVINYIRNAVNLCVLFRLIKYYFLFI